MMGAQIWSVVVLGGVLFAGAPASASGVPRLESPHVGRPDVQELEAVLREGTVAERLEVMPDLAAYAISGQGFTAERATRALVRALADESAEVRAESVRLLPLLGDRERALEALIGAFESFCDQQQRLLAAVQRRREQRDGSFVLELLEIDSADRLAEFPRWGMLLISSLVQFEDDRCADALRRFVEQPLERQGHSLLLQAASASLLLGQRDAVGAVVEELVEIEAADRRAEQRQRRYRKGGEDNPSRFGSLRGVTPLRDAYAPVDAGTAKSLRSLLRRHAQELGLSSPPVDPEADAWIRWWRAEKSQLPRRLGRVSALGAGS